MALPIGARRLTRPRAREASRQQPLIIRPVRADITDYGTPGSHLTGPWAKTRQFVPRIGDLLGFGPEDDPGFDPCREDGGYITIARDVGIGVTDVTVSNRIPWPFIIKHIWAIVTGAVTTAASCQFRISEDDDTSGGTGTSGISPEFFLGSLSYAVATGVPLEVYPDYRVDQGNKFVKFITVNTSAVAVVSQFSMSLKFLR